MPLDSRHGLINTGVALHPKGDADGRAVRAFAGVERIYWAQCPRCLRRYWFALRYDTGTSESQFFGRRFRERFRAEDCPEHTLAPLDLTADPLESP